MRARASKDGGPQLPLVAILHRAGRRPSRLARAKRPGSHLRMTGKVNRSRRPAAQSTLSKNALETDSRVLLIDKGRQCEAVADKGAQRATNSCRGYAARVQRSIWIPAAWITVCHCATLAVRISVTSSG